MALKPINIKTFVHFQVSFCKSVPSSWYLVYPDKNVQIIKLDWVPYSLERSLQKNAMFVVQRCNCITKGFWVNVNVIVHCDQNFAIRNDIFAKTFHPSTFEIVNCFWHLILKASDHFSSSPLKLIFIFWDHPQEILFLFSFLLVNNLTFHLRRLLKTSAFCTGAKRIVFFVRLF